jgi:uncharacterized damage-inducible protein DinB
MNLTQACSNILDQLTYVVEQLTDEQFSMPSRALSNSSIGQHLRHTLEFFLCVEHGYRSGLINYDKRAHDKVIEREKAKALETVERIGSFVRLMNLDKSLLLEVNYDIEKESNETLTTTVKRELVYNIEHAVHHMALMKIGIREIAPGISLPADFGIAASTLRHQSAATVNLQ